MSTSQQSRWHAPWKLHKVISDYVGDVRCCTVEKYNRFFFTGSDDGVIRIWDLHSGKLKDSLINNRGIRGLAFTKRDNTHFYSCGEGGQRKTLINHRKSVKALALNPTLNEFISASQDSIKKWTPDGKFIQNLPKHNAAINCLAVNKDDVLVSGTADGRMQFWDWTSGHNFQTLRAPIRPGSTDSGTEIFSITFDKSGTRLITTGADKTIKIYKEDKTASIKSVYN